MRNVIFLYIDLSMPFQRIIQLSQVLSSELHKYRFKGILLYQGENSDILHTCVLLCNKNNIMANIVHNLSSNLPCEI